MSVVDLLQTLDIGRKSCRLTISHEGQQCEMQFDNGQLVHASLGDVSGEAAVYAVVAWTEGTFLIDFERASARGRSPTAPSPYCWKRCAGSTSRSVIPQPPKRCAARRWRRSRRRHCDSKPRALAPELASDP